MNRHWTFTDLEFLVQWEQIQDDFIPVPLSYVAPRTEDEFRRAKSDARESLAAKRDPAFDEVMQAIAFPDIRLTLRALDERNPTDVGHSIRIHAVRRGDRGYVVRQLPGESIWHSNGFVITECDAIGLADAVVDQIPDAPASKVTDLVLTSGKGAPEYEYVRSAVFDSFDDSADRKTERFLATPFSTIALIQVIQGSSRFGPRGLQQRRLELRDLVDDGRCLITFDSPRIATGVDAKRLVALINKEIAEIIRGIKDERK